MAALSRQAIGLRPPPNGGFEGGEGRGQANLPVAPDGYSTDAQHLCCLGPVHHQLPLCERTPGIGLLLLNKLPDLPQFFAHCFLLIQWSFLSAALNDCNHWVCPVLRFGPNERAASPVFSRVRAFAANLLQTLMKELLPSSPLAGLCYEEEAYHLSSETC